MSINPISIKERVALGEWTPDERDFLLTAVNNWLDTCASRSNEPNAVHRIREIVEQTPSFSTIEKVILRQVLDAYVFSIVRGNGIEFRICRHAVKPSSIIEVWRDGKFVGAIYPTENGVMIDSAHLTGYDDGRAHQPPVARVTLEFVHRSERGVPN